MKNTKDVSLACAKLPYLVKEKVAKSVTFKCCPETLGERANQSECGFSLIELLLVVVTIGIIAALAIPNAQRAIRAGENGNAYSTMRTIASTQVGYFSQSGRWARLTEVNNLLSSSIGTQAGNEVIHGKFIFSMTPAAPTDAELKNGYTITATRNIASEDIVYVYEVTQTGEIRQILP